MNQIDEEIESIANSIENNLKTINKLKIFFKLFLFFSMIFLLYLNFIKYPGEQRASILDLIIMGLLFGIPMSGLMIIYDEKFSEIFIFKNVEEKLFFYLFRSWKYHNEKQSKKYLEKCIEELKTYFVKYYKLPYTESILFMFNNLIDVLEFHIYPKLGKRIEVKSQDDLSSQVSAWDIFKSLAIDFYHKKSIDLIEQRVSNLKSCFERDETVKIANDNFFIRVTKTTFNWNITMYNDSVTYRFVFYFICTIIIDYYLISNNLVKFDTLIPATLLIPIMAPYYLAPQKYKH